MFDIYHTIVDEKVKALHHLFKFTKYLLIFVYKALKNMKGKYTKVHVSRCKQPVVSMLYTQAAILLLVNSFAPLVFAGDKWLLVCSQINRFNNVSCHTKIID